MRDLYWGDNLKILRDYISDESVDLIPLDPPFNSNRNYNVLFRENNRVESNAQIGLFITLEEPTGPMQREAVEAGFYRSNLMQRDYPRIQILTIRELFDRREPQMPPMFNPYRLAERRHRDDQQRKLFDTGTD
jgi:hypothetical protein